ncbi:MAG: sterol desaturase family protein [Saprospiraceae bacterium]
METLVAYFSQIPSAHRAAILVGGITIFWLIENAVPVFQYGYKKWSHAWINIFFTATTIVVNFAMAFLLLKATDWAVANDFGLLQWLPALPLWAFMLLGLLLLDLTGAWLAHWAEHKVKWMWRFHLVHHTDPHVDTTTANRHHPGESVIRFVFTTLGALLCGAPMWLVFMYQSLSVALSQFNHANVRLPEGIERALSYVLVTPRMHRVHHHYVLPYTDSNYGNIFSIWDRLFGTYMDLPGEALVFGIDTHMESAEQSDLGTLLKIPFGTYRPPVGSKFKE